MNNVDNWDAKRYPNNINVLEDAFHRKILSSCQLVQMYEDPLLQQKARSVLPVDLLQARARERLSSTSTSTINNGPIVSLMDCLLVELLAWFKQDFFRWFDAPSVCSKCTGRMIKNAGDVEPDADEIRWGGMRVEEYRCADNCGTSFRFPRYNHPEKLLQTKVGRCGEWANCFTLCCVSLGLEARYVLDWTDHVWTEVHSVSQRRWLHCDPCENLCDSPLVYESGWNKPISYVLAFSKDDIQDVTWRYSSRHAEVLSRRIQCRETWLLQTICLTRRRLQADVGPSYRKAELDRRLVIELVEFMSPRRTASVNELGGRSSGSLDWRRTRGEIEDKTKIVPRIFELTEDEATSKKFQLRYCSATDMYLRSVTSSSGANTFRGWQSGVNSASNVFRKVESDWRQVYLARTVGSDVGRVSWKVVVGGVNADLTVKTVAVRCDSVIYENGLVNWKIYAGDKCVSVTNDSVPFVTSALSGEREVTIGAELSGGLGSVSWQHAQLFRLSLNDTDKFPFDICITFK